MGTQRIEQLNAVLSYSAVGSLLFLVIGIRDLDNYLSWEGFTVVTVLSGVLIALALYWLICHLLPEARSYKNEKGVGIVFPLIFISSMASFGMGSIINGSFVLNRECEAYVIQEMGTSGSIRARARAHFIFIHGEDGRERLSVGKALYELHNEGDSIALCLTTGILGFRYYEMNTNRQHRTTGG